MEREKLEACLMQYENDAMFFIDALAEEDVSGDDNIPENVTKAAHKFVKSRKKLMEESGEDFDDTISDPELDKDLMDTADELLGGSSEDGQS